MVVSAGTTPLPGYEDSPVDPRYDVVYVLDDRGWYYRYSHLQSIDPAIKPGATVAMGQKIGLLGKEGGSGGWSHLHFEIVSRQPSGRWGTQEGYAFLWEAYLREQQPAVLAVARPHHLAQVGEKVALDGARSWSRSGTIARHDWTFSDGSTASGPRVERVYDQPGEYSEILKVTDNGGNVSYDFAVVQVLDRRSSDPLPPGIHAAYAPTQEHPPRRPDHLQGSHLRHHRRERDLGLRRRHRSGQGMLRRQRQETGPRRLCRWSTASPSRATTCRSRAHGSPRPQGSRTTLCANQAGEVTALRPLVFLRGVI